MKRILATVLASFLFFAPSLSAQTNPWLAAYKIALESIVRVEHAGGTCTGFVIHSAVEDDNGDADYILTAGHCDASVVYAHQQPAFKKSKSATKDVMVLQTEDTGKPALRLAKESPTVGQEVASLGYGYSLERPMFRVANISDDKTYIPVPYIGGPLFLLDSTFVEGQSGGPVVNQAGEVVMVVQRSTTDVALGIGLEIVRNETGRYWELK